MIKKFPPRWRQYLLAGTFGLMLAGTSHAATFDTGIPANWTCIGNCGASGANGVVTLAPGTGSGSQYGWISTANSDKSVGGLLPGVGGSGTPTNGTVLRSNVFSADAGESLEFYFNYITSDGAGYADYAWARLLDASMNQVALLFTARTAPTGSIVPGFSMPTPEATLPWGDAPIIPGGPQWAPLGDDSGKCYNAGCGYTGWVLSTYDILDAGNYILEFGVTNWNDTAYASGMAFDGVTIGGVPINPSPVSEPALPVLIGLGLLALRARKWRSN